jgi:type I restriction enzyme M protein
LRKLIVDLINTQNWSATGTDIKGDADEALLERGAGDVKSGAGQYFTPRAVISAMVDGTARLAQMNLLLHGIGRPSGPEGIEVRDALAEVPRRRASLVLANPPFGRKSGFTGLDEAGRAVREDDSYARTDFWKQTTNKQLNFLQHIYTLLDVDGRAAVVLPDNVLFEGGAGEEIRRQLLTRCDVHTLRRLPTGIFYAGGVKANVLFFDKALQASKARPTG